MGVLSLGDIDVKVLSGEFKGVLGPAKTFSPINIYTIDFKEEGEILLDEPSGFNTGLLVLEGGLKVNSEKISHGDFTLFKNEEGEISLKGDKGSKVIVLSGEPIDEEIVAHGPFVMNTMEEILEANRDFYSGKFGPLEF